MSSVALCWGSQRCSSSTQLHPISLISSSGLASPSHAQLSWQVQSQHQKELQHLGRMKKISIVYSLWDSYILFGIRGE